MTEEKPPLLLPSAWPPLRQEPRLLGQGIPRLGRFRVPLILLLIAATVSAGVVLFLFDPSQNGFYPRCSLHEATGLLCPGCGCLRALHQLSHGNVAAAFRLNPLLVSLILPAGWLLLCKLVRQTTGRQWPTFFLRTGWLWILLVVMLGFGVARNIW